MGPITRRDFLRNSAAAAFGGVVLAACSSDHKPARTSPTAMIVPTTQKGLGDPSKAPFDTVVVLMMENRSFDHLLGWLPGADGKQTALTYPDAAGARHSPWPIAPDWQAWKYADPKHDWESVAKQINNGKVDGFLKTQPLGDRYPISYYSEADLPALATLARNYTTLDRYFCSIAGATWPNRMYMHCGATDLDDTGTYPYLQDTAALPPLGVERPSKIDLAIWDRLKAHNLTGAYYYISEPMTALFESRKYDAISHLYTRFAADAAAGQLANVTFIDPDTGTIPEFLGTSNDMHPHGSVKVGDAFIAEVYEALRTSPQWDRMVFIVTFDEHGGFYDHVAPPKVRDNNINPNPGPHPNYAQLGVRVPTIVAGPYAPKGVDHSGPFEHCSILRMIEWRWGLEPMHDRDRYATNLGSVLDFSGKRSAIALPPTTAPMLIPRPS